jgi:hypothetical protein
LPGVKFGLNLSGLGQRSEAFDFEASAKLAGDARLSGHHFALYKARGSDYELALNADVAFNDSVHANVDWRLNTALKHGTFNDAVVFVGGL